MVIFTVLFQFKVAVKVIDKTQMSASNLQKVRKSFNMQELVASGIRF